MDYSAILTTIAGGLLAIAGAVVQNQIQRRSERSSRQTERIRNAYIDILGQLNDVRDPGEAYQRITGSYGYKSLQLEAASRDIRRVFDNVQRIVTLANQPGGWSSEELSALLLSLRDEMVKHLKRLDR